MLPHRTAFELRPRGCLPCVIHRDPGFEPKPRAGTRTRVLSRALRLGPQESPGVFNEVTFRALDWLLDEARRNGIRIILSFADNWKYPGAAPQP